MKFGGFLKKVLYLIFYFVLASLIYKLLFQYICHFDLLNNLGQQVPCFSYAQWEGGLFLVTLSVNAWFTISSHLFLGLWKLENQRSLFLRTLKFLQPCDTPPISVSSELKSASTFNFMGMSPWLCHLSFNLFLPYCRPSGMGRWAVHTPQCDTPQTDAVTQCLLLS